MYLITEHLESSLDYITEEKNGKKNVIIEGIFMQAESKNRNGRVYPRTVMERAVDKYVTEQVVKGRAVGELNHPDGPSINLDKVSHRITELNWNGNNVMGKALILDTPMGQIVKGLVEGGVQLGVSSRGMGSLVTRNGVNMVGDDFHLSTIDIVQDPSAPEAFVNGIMEGVDWIWDNGILKQQDIEKYGTEIKKASKKNLAEAQMMVWKDFLSKL
tara:strand:- start:1301 stop:1945 length:645 start_codon:yes stop_codon:yes gene_type:complete